MLGTLFSRSLDPSIFFQLYPTGRSCDDARASLINYSISSYQRPNFNYRVEPSVFVNRTGGGARCPGGWLLSTAHLRRVSAVSVGPASNRSCLTFTLIYLQLQPVDLHWNDIVPLTVTRYAVRGTRSTALHDRSSTDGTRSLAASSMLYSSQRLKFPLRQKGVRRTRSNVPLIS